MRSDDPTCAELLGLVWRELSAVIGTTATAMLLRSAAKNAARRGAHAAGFSVERIGFEYGYTVVDQWKQNDAASMSALRAVLLELRPLLVELTGPVLIRRLAMCERPEVATIFMGKEPRDGTS